MFVMKKSKLFFVVMLIAATVISCDKSSRNDNGMDLVLNAKDQPITVKVESAPVSDGDLSNPQDGTIPYIIPGENRGGNRTCAEVAAAWKLDSNPFLCGNKIDYDGENFVGNFPSWLNVTVTDGTFVSFSAAECGMIGDKYYKVGAVIVKGSSDANVYYYPDGTLSDSGLSSPKNASGSAAGLSNLTFCFIECDKELPELVIALKTYLLPGERIWAASRGTGSSNNSLHIGYNDYEYNAENIYDLFFGLNGGDIGSITATDYVENNIYYLEVVIDTDSDDWMFGESFLYVGTAEGYEDFIIEKNGVDYSQFRSFPFTEDEYSDVRIFKIPFSAIIN